MVLGVSRSGVSLLHVQPGISSRLVSPLVVFQGARRYAGASAAATKTKGPPTSKVYSKNANLKSTTTPKVSTKKLPSAAKASSPAPSKPAAAVEHIKATPAPLKAETPAKAKLTEEEEQLKMLEQMMLMANFSPQADLWGQDITETLDVMIPRTGGILDRTKYMPNLINKVKNAFALYTLASENSIPGVDISEAKLTEKLFKWPIRVVGTQSTKLGSWLKPLCDDALKSYRQLNTAIASGDDKEAKWLTTWSHRKHVAELTRKYQKEGHRFIWRLHREVEPTRVVSLRAVEGYLASENPTMGNRLLVHALVKFDTLQSLEIYDRTGRPLHRARPGAVKSERGVLPAEQKRVTEYLVMEKRMWNNWPWVFREQMWDTSLTSKV